MYRIFGYERLEMAMQRLSVPSGSGQTCAEYTEDPNKSWSLISTRAPCCETRLHHVIRLCCATKTDDSVSLACLSHNARQDITVQEIQERSLTLLQAVPSILSRCTGHERLSSLSACGWGAADYHSAWRFITQQFKLLHIAAHCIPFHHRIPPCSQV